MAAIWENIYEPTQTQLLLYLMFTQDSKAVMRENFEGPMKHQILLLLSLEARALNGRAGSGL